MNTITKRIRKEWLNAGQMNNAGILSDDYIRKAGLSVHTTATKGGNH